MDALNIGSKEWADKMFLDPPARKIKGRSRYTHRHAPVFTQGGQIEWVESRGELVAAIVLEYLRIVGAVQRWKPQPFTLALEENESYTPDFAFTGEGEKLYVVEVKTERFISRETEGKLSKAAKRLNESGIETLLWTDRRLLTKAIRHNFQRMYRASHQNISDEAVIQLVALLQSRGDLTIDGCLGSGFDIDVVAYAAWLGKVFINLFMLLEAGAKVSLTPKPLITAVAFNSKPTLTEFWNLLGDA